MGCPRVVGYGYELAKHCVTALNLRVVKSQDLILEDRRYSQSAWSLADKPGRKHGVANGPQQADVT